MAIDLNVPPGMPHATAAQKAFDEARLSHDKAMDAAASAEQSQYHQVLRSLLLFADLKSACDSDQKTELGALVATKASEQWDANVPYTAAIFTGLADAMGTTVETLCTAIQEATLPTEFQNARVAIAQA